MKKNIVIIKNSFDNLCSKPPGLGKLTYSSDMQNNYLIHHYD